MKITAFDELYSQNLSSGITYIGGSNGSNSGFAGGDVVGEPGALSVVGLRSTVALSSNLTGGIGDVLTIIATNPRTAQFATPSNSGAGSGFELNIEGGQSVIKAHGSTGATETIDPTDGNVHTLTLDANCTITLNAPSGTGAATLVLWVTEDSTGGWTITWPGSVTEQGTHDTTLSTTQRVILESIDGGTSWLATWVGSSSSTSGGGFDVTPPQSIPMPPWVKPTGSGVITADAQGRLTIDSGSTYKGFPGMAFLEGRLHLVYRDGSAHDSNDGVIKYRTSDDLGRTWSSATTILTGAAGHDLRDPSIVALSTGRLLVGYDDGIYPAAPLAVRVIYSDNRGQSWSSAYVVPVTGMSGECAGTSQMVELRDGTVLLPAFGNNGGNSFCVLFKSTDGGLTFPTQITVASSGSRHYQELQIRVLASGKIVGLMRSDTNAHTWRTVSTDAGATWSSPTDVLTASARPDFVEFFPGALLFFGRSDNTNFYARWAVSWDEGATWTALQNVDGSTDVWEYGAPVVLAPGYVAVSYGLQNSSSDADLYLRYYHDGYGTDPLGNVTALSVTATPSGAAGGDLSGTYPNPTVAKVNGVTVTGTPSTGQVLTATGTTAASWATPSTSSSGASDHEHVMDCLFSGDGSATAFELPAAPFDAYSVAAYVAGVLTEVTLSGSMLTTATFGSAPGSAANNVRFDIVAAVL